MAMTEEERHQKEIYDVANACVDEVILEATQQVQARKESAVDPSDGLSPDDDFIKGESLASDLSLLFSLPDADQKPDPKHIKWTCCGHPEKRDKVAEQSENGCHAYTYTIAYL